MTASPRRRADAFDAWLDGALAGSRDGSQGGPAEFEDLRPVVLALRDHRPVDPSLEFVASLRESLVERARVELVPQRRTTSPGATSPTAPARAPRPRRSRDRWVAAGVAALALTVASGAGAVASRDALPGEALYPLKRVIEDTQVALRGADGDRGRSLLGHAADRLDELDRLAVEGSTDLPLLVSTLDDFRDQADTGTSLLLRAYGEDPRPASVDDVRAFAATATDRLDAVRDALPAEVAPAVEGALADLADLDARALEVCGTCSSLPALTPPTAPASFEESAEPTTTDAGAPAGAPSGRGFTSRAGRGGGDDPDRDAPGGRTGRRAAGTDDAGGGAGTGTDRPGGPPTGEVPSVTGGLGAPSGGGADGGLVQGTLRGLDGAAGASGTAGAAGTGAGGRGSAGSGSGGGRVRDVDGVLDDLVDGLGRDGRGPLGG